MSKDKATLRTFLANSNAPCQKVGQRSTFWAWCIVCYIKGTNGGNYRLALSHSTLYN